MADAVCADIEAHRAHQVAAVVVSHGDAEDLADRIRARLAAGGVIAGSVMTGPGWCGDRDYRAGDRVLLHARCGGSASPLVNGTTATVTSVGDDALTITLENGATAVLGAEFVRGTRRDGSPNLSHAWARTVDGAQGGTWETCHLLGSMSLDAYRGYTGQSRSRQPTRTWNTTRVGVVDHGGILADQRDGAEQVAGALARQPDPSLAARSDPWTVDRDLRQLIDEHERALAGRPADSQKALAAAAAEAQRAQARLANMDAIAGHTARQLDQLGALAGLSRPRSRPASNPGEQAGGRHRERRRSSQRLHRGGRTGRPAAARPGRSRTLRGGRGLAGRRARPGCGTSLTITGPTWSRPVSGLTIPWRSGSTNCATPAPPPSPTCTGSTPPSPPTESPNGSRARGQLPDTIRAHHDAEDSSPNAGSRPTSRAPPLEPTRSRSDGRRPRPGRCRQTAHRAGEHGRTQSP